MKYFPHTFAIIDTETTGMRPPYSRIIDIGIIRVENGKEVERFHSLVNPGVALPGFIERLTNISDEDLATAPPFEEIALRVKELLDGAVFVAHNAPFDYAFVQSEFSRLGMPYTAETLCSVRLSRALSPKSKTHNLDSVMERYGIDITGTRHRALPDADAVWQFFKRASKEHPAGDIKKALARARSGNGGRITPAVARDTFTDLPDSAGVYFFYGPEQELLYIGKSKHVRTRARSHFHTSADHKEQRIQAETNMVSSIRTSGELSALLLESALIKAQSPMYNRALRKRKTLVTAHRQQSEAGYSTLSLERTADIDPNAGVLSVFRTTTQAKEKLRALAKEHQLCHKLLGIETGSGACFAYQLGTCAGACIGKEEPETYNERFTAAFAARALRAWPYGGTLMIDERESESAGTVLFIRDWVLLGAFKYDGEAYEPLFEGASNASGFEYDTYKILARYILNPKNKRSLKVLSATEYAAAIGRATGTTADEMTYEEAAID